MPKKLRQAGWIRKINKINNYFPLYSNLPIAV